ncbi:PREDICTED: octopamine receptor beta-1R-like [Priapulus caudatus]|uniref:Octopamine receptor beta-1R-like n=1 Tax=Priapulus caudatus TaxID=37621 RepID=A0ABM1EG22_PRICU|nr:PREDICTED: octopamine receptor beta-1R-like [Priapulus caudatus]
MAAGELANRTNASTDSDHQAAQDTVVVVLSITVMCVVMTAAVLGNLLVIVSVALHRSLRSRTNHFIMSLAVADILVALFAMTFNFSVTLAQRWLFGQFVCDFWNSCDVLFSTASILHLCCISVDRYIAVTNPLMYPTVMTHRKVAIMLTVVWLSSALISFVPIYTQWYTTPGNYEYMLAHPDVCHFKVNRVYAVISSTVSFWLPAVVMLFTYHKVYREANKQARQIHRETAAIQVQLGARAADCHLADGAGNEAGRTILRREHKAEKTLGMIMGCFLICWLPFFTWYLATHLCGDACVTPDVVVSVLFWIGYSNSGLNPIIYAFFNKDLRRGFHLTLRRLFCCRDTDHF